MIPEIVRADLPNNSIYLFFLSNAATSSELYKKALTGEITGFTGISDPYEHPLASAVTIETDKEEVEMSAFKGHRGT